jgi:UDP-glucose 4-epimerase
MAILVTGGAGYIGSHMCWALDDAAEEIVVIDNLSTGFEWALPPSAKFYHGGIDDVAMLAKIQAENEIEAIIHFAGSIIVPESVSNPMKYYRNNTANSRGLIEFAVEAGIKYFVFSSTAAVYGTPTSDEAVDETVATNPESPYGTSKLMTEHMLKDTSFAHDFSFTALRYFNVCGADPKGRTGQSTQGATHLIKVACEAALGKREKIEVFGTDYPTPDGTCVRDYIHVWDLVNAHLCALKRMRMGGESIIANCGYGKGYSVLEVLEAVKKVNGNDFRIDFSPRRAGDAVRIIANSDLIKKELGWGPKLDNLDLILRHALDWETKLSSRNVI